MLDRAKAGTATAQQLFDYYLGWLDRPERSRRTSSSSRTRGRPSRASGGCRSRSRTCGASCGAPEARRRVVLGGHSLGGSITTAYATWDFGGRPGARDLAGLVFIDGGSGPTPSAPQARPAPGGLQAGSPWLAFGGIAAPFAGLFHATGALGVLIDPAPVARPGVPAAAREPHAAVPGHQRGRVRLRARHRDLAAHAGRRAGAPRPPRRGRRSARLGRRRRAHADRRYAEMFAGAGLQGLDGTAWYHPLRLTIDAGAVAAGNAQRRRSGSSACRPRTATTCRRDRASTRSPRRWAASASSTPLGARAPVKNPAPRLTLVDRHTTYAHNDPAAASPDERVRRHAGAVAAGRGPARLRVAVRHEPQTTQESAPAKAASLAGDYLKVEAAEQDGEGRRKGGRKDGQGGRRVQGHEGPRQAPARVAGAVAGIAAAVVGAKCARRRRAGHRLTTRPIPSLTGAPPVAGLSVSGPSV